MKRGYCTIVFDESWSFKTKDSPENYVSPGLYIHVKCTYKLIIINGTYQCLKFPSFYLQQLVQNTSVNTVAPRISPAQLIHP